MELEAKLLGEGVQLMGQQFIQLELRLGKNPSRSFRPVNSAEILWQFWASSSFGVSLAHDGSWRKSILEKEKLNGTNFLDRYRNLRIVIRNEQKLHHLEEALPEAPPATATAVVRNAYTRRVAEQQEVACLMLAFHACKQEEGQSVSTYVLKMKAYLDRMEHLGYPMPLTIPELHAMLKLVEKGIPKKTPAVLAIRQELEQNKASASGTSGALDLYVGNGHSAAVEAIGSFELILPSGMILFLRIIYVILMFFPRDGIFEIDMHNHISNERSIYTCSNKKTKHNLDSTFLWNCHLGHVNKKRIENLQHDRLLESIDDESFDVYVSYISGKMARKPFTHASERAGDLLGITHSDVCRPFRTTSREGANYYVTFTDDFSRYGYVYLIKHKHEVFEMLKTFQNEVEIQLEKTIKTLRSDRGGDLTTLPMSFWGYALESVARILNIGLTKKVNKIPYEMWHGKVPNLSYLKV
ncbi:retrotransposon protein, putative, ty1-copia subclass [Tanacetum coccineum]